MTENAAKLRAVFMGSPDFSLTSLAAVAKRCDLRAVVSQPDRPAGRGRKLTPPPVKVAAEALGVPVLQPTKVRDGSLAAALRELDPEIIVVTAYGRILPTEILELPRYGCINVHASLLPRWRGAAPIQRAVLSGDAETGVAIMQMDVGCDTGDVFEMARTPIGANETSGELFERLSTLGGEVLDEFLRRFPDVPSAQAQDHAAAVHAAKLEKAEGSVDFSHPAAAVHDHIRGMDPWPGAFADLRLGEREPMQVKLFASRRDDGSTPVEGAESGATPGTIFAVDDAGLHVRCGDGRSICLREVQAPGKRRMPATAFAAGHSIRDAASEARFVLPSGT